MKQKLNIALFPHSLVSDWNHGNAHFLRGLMRELVRMGHRVRCYEELGGWSLTNMMKHEGERAIAAIDGFRAAYPELDIRFYQSSHEGFRRYLEPELKDVDLVLLHEWNDPFVVNCVLEFKKQCGFIALLHDSHHRAYTKAAEILKFHLHMLDGVLAFGETLRRIYADGFGVNRTWTFHEAADVQQFRPLVRPKQIDLLWIGNWGDEERSQELDEFLTVPAAYQPKRRVVVHGVRYPDAGIKKLLDAGIEYRGYLPNLASPEAYAASVVALLACGVPLLCSPWSDEEHLFNAGHDYLIVKDSQQMKAELENLLRDPAACRELAEHGLKTVRQRHTCAHRAEQLISICEEVAA
jgi:spore maturation protein CgeB